MKLNNSQIPGVLIGYPQVFPDNRGWLTEIWRNTFKDVPQPAMAYVSCTKPGVTRGPHEHNFQTDVFIFMNGNWKVILWDNRLPKLLEPLTITIKQPTVIIVPPKVVHAYANVGFWPAVVLNMPNQLYRGQSKSDPPDEIRHESNPSFIPKIFPWWYKLTRMDKIYASNSATKT